MEHVVQFTMREERLLESGFRNKSRYQYTVAFSYRLITVTLLLQSTEALLKPKSLWDALFFDDRQYKIEEVR